MVNVVNGEGVDGDDAGVSRPPCSAAEFCRTFDVTLILAESLANRKTHHGPDSRVQVSLQSSLVPSPCLRFQFTSPGSRARLAGVSAVLGYSKVY